MTHSIPSHTLTSSAERPQDAVIATVEAMTRAFEARDLDGVMQTYLDGAVVVFEPGAPVSGDAAIRAKFSELFQLSPKFTYHAGHEAFVSGETAVHIAPWTMTGTTPDGESVEQSGLSVAVLRRDARGAWRLVLDDPHGAFLQSGSSKP